MILEEHFKVRSQSSLRVLKGSFICEHFLKIDQRCSIEYKSGNWGGQSKSLMPLSSNHVLVMPAVR